MFKGTIKSQLQLIAIVPVLIVIMIISIFLLKDSLQIIDDNLDSRADELSTQIALMSEFYFYTGDVDKLTEIADNLIKRETLNYIRFLAQDKSPWIFRTKSTIKGKSKEYSLAIYSGVNTDDFTKKSTINTPENIIGYIEIGLTQNNSYSKRKAAYSRVILIALVAMLFAWGLSYFVSRKLTAAIMNLVETASNIEQKDFEKRCKESGTGELLSFQKTFNKMAEALQLNEQALQEEIDQTILALKQTIEELALKEKDLDETREKTIKLVREKAIADERSRIMRDIHDGIGGQLMASLSLIEKEKNSTVRENIHSILSDCLDDFRLIINSLNVHASTLSAILADYKFSLSKKADNLEITINWAMDEFADFVTLAPQKNLHLLRILQEAFTNILKHSGATAIDFNTYEEYGHAIIVIEDNGSFLPTRSNETGHGFLNMQSRTKELGARLDITQSKKGGCRILLRIPLSENLRKQA